MSDYVYSESREGLLDQIQTLRSRQQELIEIKDWIGVQHCETLIGEIKAKIIQLPPDTPYVISVPEVYNPRDPEILRVLAGPLPNLLAIAGTVCNIVAYFMYIFSPGVVEPSAWWLVFFVFLGFFGYPALYGTLLGLFFEWKTHTMGYKIFNISCWVFVCAAALPFFFIYAIMFFVMIAQLFSWLTGRK
jgi:hypothetical protein